MPGGLGSSDQSARIRQLEHLVKEYKAELESHSRDSRDIEEKIAKGQGLVKQSVLDEAQSQITSLQSQITSFESTLSELQNANTTLDAEVNDLMRRVASGEYNPKSERVIEFQNNPAAKIMAVRNQVLEDLRKENEALLRSGGGSGGGEGSVPRESWERLCKEKEELERGHAKRLMRLKEVSFSFVPLDWRYRLVCILVGGLLEWDRVGDRSTRSLQ
jgi:mitotic spindle assembly checkpoint protein MAD1